MSSSPSKTLGVSDQPPQLPRRRGRRAGVRRGVLALRARRGRRARPEPLRPAAAGRRQRAQAPRGLHVADRRARQPARRHGLPVAHLPGRRRDLRAAGRRLGADLELRVARRQRRRHVGAALRDRDGADRRRLPDPRRHERQLRRRPDAVGHAGSRARSTTAGTSGSAIRRARARARSGRRWAPSTTRRSRVDPGRRRALPDRGPARRRPLPLHADALSRPLRDGPARGRARRRPGRLASRPSPTRAACTPHPPPGRRHARVQRRRGDLVRLRHTSTSRPRATTASGPTTTAAGALAHDLRRRRRRSSGVDNLTVTRAGELFVCEDGGNMEICVIKPGRDRRAVPAAHGRGRRRARPTAATSSPASSSTRARPHVLLRPARVRLRRHLRGARAVPRAGAPRPPAPRRPRRPPRQPGAARRARPRA